VLRLYGFGFGIEILCRRPEERRAQIIIAILFVPLTAFKYHIPDRRKSRGCEKE